MCRRRRISSPEVKRQHRLETQCVPLPSKKQGRDRVGRGPGVGRLLKGGGDRRDLLRRELGDGPGARIEPGSHAAPVGAYGIRNVTRGHTSFIRAGEVAVAAAAVRGIQRRAVDYRRRRGAGTRIQNVVEERQCFEDEAMLFR